MKKGIWYAYKAFTPLAYSSLALSFCRVRSVLKDSWCGLSKCFLAAFLSLGGYVVSYITVEWLPVVSWLSLLYQKWTPDRNTVKVALMSITLLYIA